MERPPGELPGELEANELRQRLEALADALPALVALIDAGERYRYVNAAYADWFGHPREWFIGRSLADVFGTKLYGHIREHVRSVLSGEPQQFRVQADYPTGARDVDVHYNPVRESDGTVSGFSVLVNDVSHERKLAAIERESVESHKRAADRLERLLDVAGKLAVATSEEEVARAVVDAGVEAIDAAMGGFWLVEPGCESLILTRSRGFLPQHEASFARIETDGDGPVAEAARTKVPVWLASRAEYAARYPQLEAQHRPESAIPIGFGVVPLLVGEELRGTLAFVFHEEGGVVAENRTYIEVLAAHAAHALQRVQLHVDLVESLETRKAMIQSSPGAIVLLDSDGAVRSWNPAASRMFGWDAEEVIGEFLPTIAGERRDEFREVLAGVIAGSTASFETKQRTRNGPELEVMVHAAPVRRGSGASWALNLMFDVSERKRVERGRQLVTEAGEVLARSLDWEQTIPRLAEIPVPEFADWCAVFHLEGEELVCMTQSGEEDDSEVPRLRHVPGVGGVSAAIASGEPQVMIDMDDADRERVARSPEHLAILRKADMRSYLAVPMRAGSLVGAFLFGSRTRNFDDVDVTIADGIAARAAGAIENARLYREATEARAEAEAANRAKDEFLAMLSHELRNPLAPITTALELMDRQSPGPSREREVIARQVEHLGRLVDDLLDVARITRGSLELAVRRIAIADVVNSSIELASPLFEDRCHELVVDVQPGLEVDGDPTRLAQVVTNLLTNAARYTPPEGRIELIVTGDEDEVVVRVRDNGIGIPPEVIPTMFETFAQGRRSFARTEGGLGLGLSIVKGLVVAHGGTVSARSDGNGAGSEFEVRLPKSFGRVAPPTPTALPVMTGAEAVPRRILVVDDNEDAADLLAELLVAFGHDTRTAYDGPTALDLASRFEPEIGLLDLGLPVMDGFELAQRFREDPRHRKMRLIAVTGYVQERDRARTRAAGFDDHLSKPVSLHDLERILTD